MGMMLGTFFPQESDLATDRDFNILSELAAEQESRLMRPRDELAR